MHRSHPVEKSKLEKEFIDRFLDGTTLQEQVGQNIKQFVSVHRQFGEGHEDAH